jgi:fluoride ion exporter CrcB/FEX
VLANRADRMTETLSLTTQTRRTNSIKGLLFKAFDRSKSQNEDMRAALRQGVAGDLTTFLTDAYEQSYQSSNAATAAKRAFADAFNSLLYRLGYKRRIDHIF